MISVPGLAAFPRNYGRWRKDRSAGRLRGSVLPLHLELRRLWACGGASESINVWLGYGPRRRRVTEFGKMGTVFCQQPVLGQRLTARIGILPPQWQFAASPRSCDNPSMDTPQMIVLDDVVLRDDLDPRLGERDDDLIAQYADIFDALPPIEINQHNEVIDGWHRVRAAERAKRTEIAYVVVETDGDDDLSDRMWESNLKHGVQYTRDQRQTHGLKLHDRGLKTKDIAQRVGVSTSSVYSWTKELREKQKQERDAEIARLRDAGMTTREIADEVDVDHTTVAAVLENSRTGKIQQEPETKSESAIEDGEVETGKKSEAEEVDEQPVDEQADGPEPGLELETEEAPAEEDNVTQDQEPPPPPEPIPDYILKTARQAMGDFTETRPDDYVARLEASDSEWMTITDDSLSNELERELLTSAAAMCLWQELMIWYQGENASSFTDAFGKIGPVFVRGQSGQWSIVSKLRSILRRLKA